MPCRDDGDVLAHDVDRSAERQARELAVGLDPDLAGQRLLRTRERDPDAPDEEAALRRLQPFLADAVDPDVDLPLRGDEDAHHVAGRRSGQPDGERRVGPEHAVREQDGLVADRRRRLEALACLQEAVVCRAAFDPGRHIHGAVADETLDREAKRSPRRVVPDLGRANGDVEWRQDPAV